MSFSIPLIAVVAAVSIGYSVAENRAESLLLLRLIGYSLLSWLTLNILGLPLPIGFGLALFLAHRATVNQRARQATAIVTLVLWFVGLFI